jgi:hypothetical protein
MFVHKGSSRLLFERQHVLGTVVQMLCADNGLWWVLTRDSDSSQMGMEREHLVRPTPHNPSNL